MRRLPLTALIGPVLLGTCAPLFFVACATREPVSGQPVLELSPPAGEVAVSQQPYVLELDSQRVAISMMGLGAVVLHNFATGRSDTIGRRGSGPGEFQRAGLLVSWTRDHFAVVDPVLRRITILTSMGRLDTTIGFPLQAGGDAVPEPGGLWVSLGEAASSDSFPLRRIRSAVDTVSFLHLPPRELIPLGATAWNVPAEFAARDIWGLLADHSMWIARGRDNRVDRIGPDGVLTRGTARPFSRIRTVAADWHMFEGLPAPPTLDTIRRPLAPTKALFQDVTADPNGNLWFWLNQPAGYRIEEYAVQRSDGSTLGRVDLPVGHKVIGLGHQYVYVLGENVAGDWVITRHPKPIW